MRDPLSYRCNIRRAWSEANHARRFISGGFPYFEWPMYLAFTRKEHPRGKKNKPLGVVEMIG